MLRRLHAARRESLADALLDVLDSGWFVLGPHVEEFERQFASYCSVDHCVSVASGTDALELGLRALGVGPGDLVGTVANAGAYACIAILACGAQPFFLEIEAERLLIDPFGLDELLAARPKAIVVTHLYGQLAAIESIVERCNAVGVPVVEDCAQAHGARRDGRMAGSVGALGCYSFYPTKNLGALGDGGAVTTSDPSLAERVRQLRQYGWSDKYTVELDGGRNSRLDELQAALLTTELPLLDGRNARRREIAAQYSSGIDRTDIRPIARGGEDDVAHLYVVRCSRREQLQQHLAAHEVQSAVHYPVPDHLQPGLRLSKRVFTLPLTERACDEVLSLPCHPALSDSEVRHVIKACNDFER